MFEKEEDFEIWIGDILVGFKEVDNFEFLNYFEFF